MSRRLTIPILILLILGLGFFIYSKVVQPQISSEKKEQQNTAVKIKVGRPESLGLLVPLIGAQKGGFFDKHGVEVELIKVQRTADALTSGGVDVVVNEGLVNLLTPAIEGHSIVWIAVMTENTPFAIISRVPQNRIKTAAVSSVGAADYQKIIVGLKSLGIDSSGINFVTAPNIQARTALLEKGEADITLLRWAPWLEYQKRAPEEVEVILDSRIVPELVTPSTIISRKETVEERSEELTYFLKAVLEGLAYAKEHPEEIKSVLVSQYQAQESLAESEYELFIESVKNVAFIPNPDVVKLSLTQLPFEVQSKAEGYDINQFVNTSLANEAINGVDFPVIKEIMSR